MNAIMLHDVRPFDPNFFPLRYQQHSFLTETAFINGLNSIEKKIVDPAVLRNTIDAVTQDGFLLTFDDGLKDHLKVAEILAERGLKAIFFVPFGILKTKQLISSHIIQFLLASADIKRIAAWLEQRLLDLGYGAQDISNYTRSLWVNNVWSAEQVFVTRILREIGTPGIRLKLLDEALSNFFKYDLMQLHEDIYLNMSNVEEIQRMGHTIGAHGWLSCDLRNEPIEVIEKELVFPIVELEKLKIKDHYMSYANGGINNLIESEVKKLSYKLCFGTKHSTISKFSAERFNLPRFDGTKLELFHD